MKFSNKTSKIDTEELKEQSKMIIEMNRLGIMQQGFSQSKKTLHKLDEKTTEMYINAENTALECITNNKSVPEDIEKLLLETKEIRQNMEIPKKDTDFCDLDSLFN
jgi:hypothetical protein